MMVGAGLVVFCVMLNSLFDTEEGELRNALIGVPRQILVLICLPLFVPDRRVGQD